MPCCDFSGRNHRNADDCRDKSRYEHICEILESIGTPLDPLAFLEKLYHNTKECLNYVLSTETTTRTTKDGSQIVKIGTYRSCRDDEELLELSRFRSDVYVPPQTFCNGRLSSKSIRDHHAIVLDLDDLTTSEVKKLVDRIRSGKIIRPTMITASGGGLHFYYLFDKPYEGYHYRYEYLKKWKALLTAKLQSQKLGVIKMLSVIQAHRLPGSNTKKGDQVMVFDIGPSFCVNDLVIKIGGVMPERDKKGYSNIIGTTLTQPRTNANRNIAYIPNAKYGFWDYCHSRLSVNQAQEGNRECALFAMAIVGYKCRVPREEVLRIISNFHEMFNETALNTNGTLMDKSDISKAMYGYQQKYVKTKASTLAEYFGWTWGENRVKRNGKTQKEHLAVLADTKIVRNASAVTEWRQANSGGSKKACAEALGMSRNTVSKYWA